MTIKNRFVTFGLTVALSGLAVGQVNAQALRDIGVAPESHSQVGCSSSAAGKITMVSDPDVHVTATDFPAFDPAPLLTANFSIGGSAAVCVAAHFSVMQGAQETYGQRIWTMYRVEIDGVPMNGHFPLFGGPLVVGHTADQDLDMVSYNFWLRIPPGAHTIRVLYSGHSPDGSGAPGAVVAAPVLTLERK